MASLGYVPGRRTQKWVRRFALSPDGGDGSWELAAVVIIVGLGALVGLLLPNFRKPKEDILK